MKCIDYSSKPGDLIFDPFMGTGTTCLVAKEMNLKYVKRAQGDMHAVAHLTDEQISLMQTQDKGEVSVAVKVTDAQGIEPVICEMIWAWVPKQKKA